MEGWVSFKDSCCGITNSYITQSANLLFFVPFGKYCVRVIEGSFKGHYKGNYELLHFVCIGELRVCMCVYKYILVSFCFE